MTAQTVIVGGGIGGAVLAGLLGRAGRQVLVLERSLAPPTWARPEILWSRSVEVLCSLSPRERWLQAAALPLRSVEFHDGMRINAMFGQSALLDPQVQPWSTDPNLTREHLLALGMFEVRRGVEVISVLKEGGKVVGVHTRDVTSRRESDVLAAITVGDDGAQSRVREACGIELAARTFPIEFICFGAAWPAAVPPGCMRVWWNPQALATGIVGLLIAPLPNGWCSALLPAISRTLEANPEVERCWQAFRALDPVIDEVLAGRRFPVDMTRVRRPWGHAVRYGADGALLLGDAVHPVSPAGGQGANMSIADATVLAELLLDGSANVLAEYERRRRPANAASIGPTRVADWVWSAPRWLSPVMLAPFIARRMAQCPWAQRRFLHFNARLFRGAAAYGPGG